eukprot:scaffold283696_cov28-Tisochrysis_lutea.AAC.1
MARLQGSGSIRFWGFTPPLDLGDAAKEVLDHNATLCALLVGPGDTRHLLATLAATAQRAAAASAAGELAPAPVEMCVYEDRPEGLARQLLLLSIALDFELPRRERAEIYLEVLCNTLVREKTSAYIAARAASLRRMLSHEEGPLTKFIDMSMLKMKDRDAVEEVLQLYSEEVEFDAIRYRDERLRRYYDTRYDARANVLDWDYTMELKPIAPIIHKVHFREWRMTGLAFEVRNASYVAPNRSLSSMAFGRELGMSKMRRGYWGDVANSPFVAAGGVEADDPKLFEVKSHQQVKTACDVAYYNVLSWLSCIETGSPFVIKPEDFADFAYGSSVAGNSGWAKGILKKSQYPKTDEPITEEIEESRFKELTVDDMPTEAVNKEEATKEAEKEAVRAAAKAKVVANKFAKLPPFTLRLLSGEWPDVLRKPKHARKYNLLYVASHAAHLVADDRVNNLLMTKARVVMETAKFLLETRRENRKEFGKRLLELGASRGWTVEGPPGHAPDGALAAHFFLRFDADTAENIAAEAKQKFGLVTGEADDALRSGASLEHKTSGADEGLSAATDTRAPVIVESAQAHTKGEDDSVIVDNPAQVDAISGSIRLEATSDKGLVEELGRQSATNLCAITGLPAKYKDPVSGLPYANLEAFRELRKRYPAPERVLAPENSEGADGAVGEDGTGKTEENDKHPPGLPQRPIILNVGMSRRINRAF